MHPFVDFDPVAFTIGPLAVHWYGIMYLIAFATFWLLGERRRRMGRLPVGPTAFSDLAFYNERRHRRGPWAKRLVTAELSRIRFSCSRSGKVACPSMVA